jgi:hypothetical protein
VGFKVLTNTFAGLLGCYAFNNSGGNYSVVSLNYLDNLATDTGVTDLTADPWVNSATANDQYWLNDTAGGGAVLRAAGIKLPLTGVVDAPDVAATQHADPAGAGGVTFTRRNTLIGR